jgi:flagellar biosynthesis activator protein FlaF
VYLDLYKQAAKESPQAGRRREREIIERAIEKLAAARSSGAQSPEAIEALDFLRQLWTAFIEDLADDGNALPVPLRASLISIGLWIRKETELIASGRSQNFDGLIEINRMISQGLA